jgi:hypothetical protein
VPATFLSLIILLCGSNCIALGQVKNRDTILLKDAGVIQKVDDLRNKNVARPVLRIRQELAIGNPAPDFLKHLINAELSFVKRVCNPTDEQMTALVAAAKDSLGELAKIVVDQLPRVNQLGRNPEMFVGPNNERMAVNPFKKVREHVGKLLQPLVSAEQYSQYIAEAKTRDEYERDAVVENLVEMLDRKLVLSRDQQIRLKYVLIDDEDLIDLHTLRTYSSNAQYLPQLPDNLIIPILTEIQKQLWSSLSRVSIQQSITEHNPTGFDEGWLK